MGVFEQDRDFAGYGETPPKVVWPDGARVAVSITIAYEEGAERSFAAGDGRGEVLGETGYPSDLEGRDYTRESVFEYGSRAGIWRLARLVDAFGIKCTFFGCAVAYELNPDVGRYIQRSGHESACHGYRWEEVVNLSRDEERERLRAAVASMERTCGERPRGWVSRTVRSPNTRSLLVEEAGFVYDSDAFNDDLPYFVQEGGRHHLVVPYTQIHNDSRYVASPSFADPTSFFDHCRRAFDYIWDEGGTHPRMMSIGLHARYAGQPSRASAVRDFIEYALEKGDVWFARRLDIANWWIEHHEEFGHRS
jgi:peptidoglycan/xylan/chitin deacetylase (PgdA/CDA1 family)